LGAKLEEILSNTEEVEDTKFPNEYPVLFTTDHIYTSNNINVYSIPKKNWDKCFVNRIWDFKPNDFRNFGTHRHILALNNPANNLDINEKLLDE
jgi:hypothetical protein